MKNLSYILLSDKFLSFVKKKWPPCQKQLICPGLQHITCPAMMRLAGYKRKDHCDRRSKLKEWVAQQGHGSERKD
jgi:hypothetical protein